MRLIDADKLVHIICSHCTEADGCKRDGLCDDFDLLIIRHAPTIGPIVHSNWVVMLNGLVAKCPICNSCYSTSKAFSMKYCPNCGTKMDEEDKQDEID